MVLLSQAVFSQTPAPKGRAGSPSVSKCKPTFADGPTADDIESLVRQLVALGSGTKGEFETTAQFDARVQRASQPDKQYTLTYCTGLQQSSSFSIFGACDYAYDADQGTMTVYIGMEERQFKPDYTPVPAVRIKTVTRRTEHHVGTNSFGAVVPFTSRFDEDFGVVPSQASVSWFVSLEPTSPEEARLGTEYAKLREMYPTSHAPAFSFPLGVEKARDIKASLRLMLVGTVPGLLVYREDSFDAATVSDPLEVTTRRFYVQFSVNEVRIIDSRTGNVLANFHPDKR